MANVRTPRTAWIDAGLRALAAGGPDAVRVEALAQRLGVTKGGFYWHFTDRAALVKEMLDTWERMVIDAVIEYVESQGGDARTKLRRLFALASLEAVVHEMEPAVKDFDELVRLLALGGSRADLMNIELAIRDWGRRDKKVAKRLRRIDNRRMDYMRSLFSAFCPDQDEVEVRCLLAFSLFIGTHFVAADHAGRKRADVLALALRRLEA